MTQNQSKKSFLKNGAASKHQDSMPKIGPNNPNQARKQEAPPFKHEVALMFSGGIDSLLSAVLLSKEFDKVYLLTFKRGHLEFGLKNSLPNIERLKALCGEDKFVHKFISIKPLVRRVSIWPLLRDRLHYQTEVVWCVACRTTMNASALLFALENDLAAIADGSNREQVPGEKHMTGTAENYPSVVARLKDYTARYGVEFLTPVYDFGDREERRQKLAEFGFEIDYLSKDFSKNLKGMFRRDFLKRYQPLCLSGWIIHWRRNLFGVSVKQDEKKTLEYVANKQDTVISDYIQKKFRKKGIDIEELIKKRTAS